MADKSTARKSQSEKARKARAGKSAASTPANGTGEKVTRSGSESSAGGKRPQAQTSKPSKSETKEAKGAGPPPKEAKGAGPPPKKTAAKAATKTPPKKQTPATRKTPKKTAKPATRSGDVVGGEEPIDLSDNKSGKDVVNISKHEDKSVVTARSKSATRRRRPSKMTPERRRQLEEKVAGPPIELPPAVEEIDATIAEEPSPPDVRLEAVAQVIAGSMTGQEQAVPKNVIPIPSVLPEDEEGEVVSDELTIEPDVSDTASDEEPVLEALAIPEDEDVDMRHREVDAELQELSEPHEPLILQQEPGTEQVAPPGLRKVEVPPLEADAVETIPKPGRKIGTTTKVAIVVIAGAIFLAIGLLLGSGSKQPTNNSPTVSSAPASTVTSPPATGSPGTSAPGPPAGGNVVTNLSGSANRQSALFNLAAGPTKVHYNTTGGNLTVRLLPQSGSDLGNDFMCTSACDREADVIATAGTYYLDVQAGGGNWTVQVTQ